MSLRKRGPASAGPRTREIILGQIESRSRNLPANTRRIAQLVDEHPSADIIVLPELFLSGYELEKLDELAITPLAPEMQLIAQACADASTAVVFGFIESDGSEVFNSVAAFDTTGELAGVYRKVNLFGREAEVFRPGDSFENVELAGIRVGLLNCFDIEFPEPARALALDGADMLVSVAANMYPYFGDHELASRARALDNRLPHVYVNATGNSAGFTFVGGSRHIGPGGGICTSIGPDEGVRSANVLISAPVEPAVDYLQHLRAAGSSAFLRDGSG